MAEAAGLSYSHAGGGALNWERPPLVLIHGAGGHRLFWPPELRRLEGEEVYALDLPGHGSSAGEGEATIGGYAERLLDWARTLEIDGAVWVGHSMGSAIALKLALRVPSRVAGLALLGSAGQLAVEPRLLEMLGDRSRFAEAVQTVTRWSFSPAASARLVELAHERLAEAQPRTLYQDFLACDRFDEIARLNEIDVPVLVLCGRDDVMTPPEGARRLAESLPNARLEIIEGAGHMLMLEKPQAVVAAVQRFLDRFGQ